jgi:CelD/BcsL family acetyltransferase involved in cellulose biosynthesis
MDDRESVKADDRYSVEAVVTEAGLDELEDDWNRLSESSDSPNIFTTYGWYRAWLRRLVADEGRERLQPYVLAIKRDEAIVGIAPLVRRVVSRLGFRVRKVEFLTHHADYNDLIIGADQEGQIVAIVEFLARTTRQWEFIDLKDIRETQDAQVLIKNILVQASLPYRTLPEGDPCPYVQTDGGAASSINRLSRQERRTLRKRSERAATEGLRTRIIENPENEPDMLKKLMALDHEKHLHRLSPSFFGTYPEVFQALIDNLGPRGWLYVALLELGSRPIAFQFGFRCGSKLWAYATAYDRSFARLGPGTLLLPAQLDYGFEHGYCEYDFLKGDDPHKTLWSTGLHHRVRFLIWNQNWVSRLGALVYFKLHLGRRR